MNEIPHGGDQAANYLDEIAEAQVRSNGIDPRKHGWRQDQIPVICEEVDRLRALIHKKDSTLTGSRIVFECILRAYAKDVTFLCGDYCENELKAIARSLALTPKDMPRVNAQDGQLWNWMADRRASIIWEEDISGKPEACVLIDTEINGEESVRALGRDPDLRRAIKASILMLALDDPKFDGA